MNLMTTASDQSSAEDFSANAGPRLRWWFLIMAASGVVGLIGWQRWWMAAGFAAGAAMAFAGMLHLERAANAFSAKAAGERSRDSVARLAIGFVLRYTVAAVIAYVIFEGSRTAFYGFVGGLFVPVAAMSCEAGYEAWSALRGKL